MDGKCQEVSQRPSQFLLDGQTGQQLHEIKRIANQLLKAAPNNKSIKTKVTKALKAATDAQLKAWTVTWSLPSVVLVCQEPAPCQKTNYTASITNFTDLSFELQKIGAELVIELRKQTKNKRAGAKSLSTLQKLHAANLDEAGKLAVNGFSCAG